MNHEPKFLTSLVVTPLRDGVNWRVAHDLKFRGADGVLHTVPAGFVTDFASIPSLSRLGGGMMLAAANGMAAFGWWFSILLVLAFTIVWLADDLNRDDQLDGPATIHDLGYRQKRKGKSAWTMKFYWDWILFTAMRANGEPLWKCWLIWFNVAAFGWFAWYQDGRKHA